MNKTTKNLNKYFLYFGIFAFILGYISLPFGEQNENPQQPLFQYLLIFPPIISLGLVLVVASVFEELAFRGWIIKNKAGKIISYMGIIMLIQLTFNSLLLSALLSPILFVLFFIIKNEKWKLILSVIATSLLFAIMHFNNYSDTFTRIFAIIQLIGLSFIICYVGLRFGFLYCILVHFINNLLAMIVLFIFLSTDYSGNLENSTYQAQLSKTPLTDIKFRNFNFTGYDTITLNSHITEIAQSLAGDERNVIFRSYISNLIKYKFTAVAKNDTINQKQLFEDLVKHANLKLDTTYELAYVLSISDTVKLNNIEQFDNSYKTSIYSLMYSIREIYKLPVIIQNEDYNSLFNFDFKVLRIRDKEEFTKRLKDEYGINIEKSFDKKAMIITIKETF